ncbi:hypothetical protein Trydic_g7032 [Trypoxylus dichotomus]
MQSIIDFICSDCNESFETASFLLKHFAQHVTGIHAMERDKLNSKQKRYPIPDLYPIKTKFSKNVFYSNVNKQENDETDSGFEDKAPVQASYR